MSWLFLAGLGIIWAFFVFPRGRGRSPSTSVEDFERGLGLLADTGAAGRWIVAPRKGAQFIGARNRARNRACVRRRRILRFLLEATGLSLLIGLFPPLRPMLVAAALFGVLLVSYLGLLLAVQRNERELARMRKDFRAEIRRPVRVGANGNGNGHHVNGNGHPHTGVLFDQDDVHVVIKPARELETASVR